MKLTIQLDKTRIRALRVSLDLTQRQVETVVEGLSNGQITQYENGIGGEPTLETAINLALFFKVRPSDLISDKEKMLLRHARVDLESIIQDLVFNSFEDRLNEINLQKAEINRIEKAPTKRQETITKKKEEIVSKAVRNPVSQAWRNIQTRCFDPKNPGYKYYGARGIKPCLGWMDQKNFLSDIPPKPAPDLSIDRIENDDGYWCGHCEECRANNWPMNVRWATWKIQNNNRRQRSKQDVPLDLEQDEVLVTDFPILIEEKKDEQSVTIS